MTVKEFYGRDAARLEKTNTTLVRLAKGWDIVKWSASGSGFVGYAECGDYLAMRVYAYEKGGKIVTIFQDIIY